MKLSIIGNRKEGAFHYVDVNVNYTKVYTRETYTGINYAWYEKSFSGSMSIISPEFEKNLETEYRKIKNEGKRWQKLERILNEFHS